ncbi:hypothetical protein [Gordonia sp. NB41Y]|uniref:hypothetical protein n=1 Tax=Gordonia sp. NB41Y TaxID=875808 RepID=UPI0002BF959D|nr:hypothetical protein [Gordonia sp. NB41Y]WLP91773.1 hypothetical protein Q9K23_05855 [Gordonia sp. NB41Y]
MSVLPDLFPVVIPHDDPALFTLVPPPFGNRHLGLENPARLINLSRDVACRSSIEHRVVMPRHDRRIAGHQVRLGVLIGVAWPNEVAE